MSNGGMFIPTWIRRARFFAHAVNHRGGEEVQMAQTSPCEGDLFIAGNRLQGSSHIVFLDAPAPKLPAIVVIVEVSASTEQLPSLLYGLLKRQGFQPMERVVMDEGPHRPVLGNDFPGQFHIRAQFHPLRIGEPLRR